MYNENLNEYNIGLYSIYILKYVPSNGRTIIFFNFIFYKELIIIFYILFFCNKNEIYRKTQANIEANIVSIKKYADNWEKFI